MAVFGYFIYTFGPALGLIRADLDLSATLTGLHSTAFAGGVVVAGATGAALVARTGRRALLWSSLVATAIGAVGLASATWATGTLFAAFLGGVGGSLVANVVTAALSDHHHEVAAAAVSESQAVAATAGIAGPLVIAAALAGFGHWQPALAVAPLSVLVAYVFFRHTPVPTSLRLSGSTTAPVSTAPPSRRALPAAYWRAWIALTLCCAIEFCLTIWSADILRDRTGASVGVAAAGVTAIVGGMALGRLTVARLARLLSLDALLYGALGIIAVGFVVFWSTHATVVAFVGLFIAGLGIGPMFPLSVARVNRTAPGRIDLAVNRAGLGTGVAVGVGPFIIGALADLVGVHQALLIVPTLIVASALALRWSRPRSLTFGGLSTLSAAE